MNPKVCPQCGTRYEGDQRFCSRDGATLVAEQIGESLTGSVLADRYSVLKKLGEGGMGEVYLAEHLRIKRKVAVKVMRSWLTNDRDAILRFHREAENASQISHPNVAAVYDFGETELGQEKRLVYLAMEYVDGKPLTALLNQEGTLNHIRASDIVSQIADALDAAHSLGIVHRDLKPDNVMIAKTRVNTDLVKLLDFGIARVMDRETQRYTKTGMIVGTPEWMSPEQISGDQIGAPADIYALGLMAFRMLTGDGAFGGGSAQDILLSKMTKPPKRLAEARPDIDWPEVLQETFDRVLAADSAARHAKALAFASDFYYAVTQLPMTPDAEAYLASLSQRAVTPTRSIGTMEATPIPGSVPVADTPRPPFGRPVGSVPTPAQPTAAISTSDALSAARQPTPASRRVSEEITAPVAVDALIAASNAATAEVEPLATPPAGAPTTAVRSSGSARALFYGGAAIAVVAVAGLAMWAAGKSGAGGESDGKTAARPPNATAPAGDSAANDSAIVTAIGPIVSATPGKMPLDTVRARSERSVYRVVGSRGQGAGFLADSQGVVLTSASFVTPNDTVSVVVDGATRLLGRVLTIDTDKGLAAVRIAMKHCQRCAALALAEDTAEAALGDSVMVIGVPSLTSRRTTSRGAIAERDDARGRFTTSLRVSAANIGGPVLVANQLVVGVARESGAGGNGIVTTLASAKEFLGKAMLALSSTPAIDSLPPSWPRRAVDPAALSEGETRTRDDIQRRFVLNDGEYTIFIMTPQVLSWRRAEIRRARELAPNSDNYCFPNSPCDIIEEWPRWRDYLTERRAVVMVQVSPRAAAQPKTGTFPRRPTFRSGNVGSVGLARDGAAARPIEAARVHAVVDPGSYDQNERFLAAIYVYSAADFVGAREIELTVFEDGTNRPREIKLRRDMLQAIVNDLALYAVNR